MVAIAQRQLCRRCLRPEVTCYCRGIRSFSAPVKIVILQHPIERKKGIGTARMAHLCIQNSRLIQGKSFESDPEVQALIRDPQYYPVVLFPGPKAINLEASTGFPVDRQLLIFVIDGTWTQAKRMLRLSPNLASLPYVSFQTDRQSEYIIRQQPMSHCLSTLESIHEILFRLEPNLDTQVLLDLFRGMVGYQLERNLDPEAIAND